MRSFRALVDGLRELAEEAAASLRDVADSITDTASRLKVPRLGPGGLLVAAALVSFAMFSDGVRGGVLVAALIAAAVGADMVRKRGKRPDASGALPLASVLAVVAFSLAVVGVCYTVDSMGWPGSVSTVLMMMVGVPFAVFGLRWFLKATRGVA